MFSTRSGRRGSCYFYTEYRNIFIREKTYGIMVSVAPGSVARLGKGDAQTCWMSAKVFVAGKLYLCQYFL